MNPQATALSYSYAPTDLTVVQEPASARSGTTARRSVYSTREVPETPAKQAPAYTPQRTARYKSTASRWQRAQQIAVFGLMLFGLLHAGNSVWTGIQRLANLVQHQQVIQQFDQALTHKNTTLKKDIARYASPIGVEELARNQLEWVGQDEILVRTRP